MTVNGGRVVGTLPDATTATKSDRTCPWRWSSWLYIQCYKTKGLTGVPATISTTTPEVCTHSTAPASKTTVLPITPRSAGSDRSKAIFAGHAVVIGVGVGVE